MTPPRLVEPDSADWSDDAQHVLDRQTRILELIARAAPLRDVLTEILTSLELLMPGGRCSVLLLDRERGTLHHGAAPSLSADYIAAIDGISIGVGAGSCGTAAALGVPVIATDVRTDPRWVDFRDLALAAGLRSCWSTPIDGRDGLPVGTFAVYYPEPHSHTEREQLLVDRFTHLASVAIDHAQMLRELVAAERDQHARAEAEAARRIAEELSHSKSQLLATMGHEARTPMQAIVGFAELLGTINLDEARRREALAHILAAAGHVMDLLTDVLDLSRLEANALSLALEPVRLDLVVSEVFGLLSARADQRQCALVHHLGEEVVLGDPRRLRQVFINLVTNAIRHGHVGGSVIVRSVPGDDSCTQVTVDDDGPGIPPELLSRIFTPFTRTARTTESAPGTRPSDAGHDESIGLGLSLAHGLVQAMGGELSVANSDQHGTSMLLRLPNPAANLQPGTTRTSI